MGESITERRLEHEAFFCRGRECCPLTINVRSVGGGTAAEKSTEKRCFFYLTICEHEHEVKYGTNRWAEENAGDHERERA